MESTDHQERFPMNTHSAVLTFAWRALLLVAGLALAWPALARHHDHREEVPGRWVAVQVQQQGEGISAIYPYRGRYYVAGAPGRPYQILLTNRSDERLLAVVSVDGINVITGQNASPNQSGYVLMPYQTVAIDGWRKSMRHVAQFEFADLQDSYAAQTGRPDNIGVIGVAVFREVQPPRPRPAPPIAKPSVAHESRIQAQDSVAGASAPAMESAGPAAAPRSLGTGHGQEQWSPTQSTQFRRASSRPVEVVRLDYDRWEALVRQGIIPRPRDRWRERQPDPFPEGFVPDPPRQW